MTAIFLKFLGGGLLVLCGGGLGWTSAYRKKETALRIAAFERFLYYILESIRFRNLPGAAVLAMAARHEDFAPFCPEEDGSFSQIRLPDCLASQLGKELEEGLCRLETAPRQNACDTLVHLSELCHRTGLQAQDTAGQALRLYPRMGACLGLLAAIVLS